MKKSLVCLSVLTSLLGASAVAHAEEASPLTANLTLATKYKYRGQDQSDATKTLRPALQGGFDYTKNGFYIGNWNSSIGFASGLEVDVYGGYKGAITKELGYDVGVLQYIYSGAKLANTTEIYGALTYSFVTAKLSYTASKRYFGIEEGRGTLYGDLSANYEIVKGVTLNAHVGGTRLPGDAKALSGYSNYIDYKLGATYDLGSGFSLAGAFVGANKKDNWGDVNKGRFIASITKAM